MLRQLFYPMYLGWDLIVLNIVIGLMVIFYTVSGGTKAVNVTQKQQMIIIFFGMVTAFTLIMYLYTRWDNI